MHSRHLGELCPTAFVTGASGGLGHAFCDMLLAEGVRVWGTARDPQRLQSLAAHSRFTALALDLEKPTEAVAAFRAAQSAAGGHFDLVIQNAGYGVFGRFTQIEPERWTRQLSDMLLSTINLSHAALVPMMAHGRGTLVHVSSIATELPIPFMAGYNIAKAGLSAFSESLLVETRSTQVAVIDFRPGDYRTDFNQGMDPAAQTHDPQLKRVWQRIEANLAAAPAPAQAARDLRTALLRRRRGIVRSGGFFQTRLAPAFAAFAPVSLLRALSARYFKVS